jgi:divalent metal cation (Fe/Co/Zn/Cd) transporter
MAPKLPANLSVDAEERSRERIERVTLRIVGACFLVLAAYVGYEAVSNLIVRKTPEHSLAGIILACVSLAVMPLLARAKRRVAVQLKSGAMHAEAKQADFCMCLSAILLGGLLLNAVANLWWADPISGLIMVPIIAKEGVGALRGDTCSE